VRSPWLRALSRWDRFSAQSHEWGSKLGRALSFVDLCREMACGWVILSNAGSSEPRRLSATPSAITFGGDLAAQPSVVGLESQDHCNSGEVEPFIE
jgi:hypothetical protein